MSLTTTVGFLYEQNEIALFLATGINILSTILKLGVRNLLSAELLASSLVADLHLVPAFIFLQYGNMQMVVSLAIGAIVANVFSAILVLIESAKTRNDEY
jgi:hypothetical protein